LVVSHESAGKCGEQSAGLVVGHESVELSILLNNDDSPDDADLLVAEELVDENETAKGRGVTGVRGA
jgi:hypothetical protein